MARSKRLVPLAVSIPPRSGSPSDLVLLLSIVDSSNNAIVSSDADGVVTTWNRATASLYEHSAADIWMISGRPANILRGERR
jgi:PAS domain-containing protein